MNRPDQFFLHNINADHPCRAEAIHSMRSRAQAADHRVVRGSALTRSWWSQTESNRRHPACKAGALPTELWPHSIRNGAKPRRAERPDQGGASKLLVGPGRLELPTLRLSGVRSNQAELRAYGGTTARQKPRLAIAHFFASGQCPKLRSANEERETETAAPRSLLEFQ